MEKVVINEATVHALYVFHYFSQCTQPFQVALLQVSNSGVQFIPSELASLNRLKLWLRVITNRVVR